MPTKNSSHGYVRSGSLDVYYDIEGTGPPVVLLHGGMGTVGMLKSLRADLSKRWTTIGVEQQGHGHTRDLNRPLRFPKMADDTAAVIRNLSVGPCHVLGFSDGGNVALGLAIRHPELIERVAICGTNANNEGLTSDMLKHLQEGAREDPEKVASSLPDMMREAYEAVAPEPEKWPMLVHRVFEQAATFEGWTGSQLAGIQSPLLTMVGDHDVVTVEHALWLSRQCPKGQLCVLPRTDHLAPVSRSSWIAAILQDFYSADLDAPMPMDATHD